MLGDRERAPRVLLHQYNGQVGAFAIVPKKCHQLSGHEWRQTQ